MAKDPAILFYTSDFLTGTMLMSDEQIGKYIKLLCLQHQKEKLSEKDMINICKSYDKDIFDKFEKDLNGFYFNKRMSEEVEKRCRYSQSRRDNRLKGVNKTSVKKQKTKITYDNHMENENENIIINKKDKENIPSQEEFLNHCREVLQSKYSQYEFSLISKYETWLADEWKTGHNKKIKNWKNTINNTIPFLKPTNNGKSINASQLFKDAMSK